VFQVRLSIPLVIAVTGTLACQTHAETTITNSSLLLLSAVPVVVDPLLSQNAQTQAMDLVTLVVTVAIGTLLTQHRAVHSTL
jgi:hypothetical protein